MSDMKYPIGIQSFEKLIRDGYLYIDKTQLIYNIVSKGQYYFLSRPRRFGKSLLLSTIEALFQGKRELFSGLAINDMEWEWDCFPVLHLDLTGKVYENESELDDILNDHLRRWENQYGYSLEGRAPDERFKALILKAKEVTNKNVVVLIDEYDQPIIHNIHNRKRVDAFRRKLNAFYSVLKAMDQHIRFAMLTGVSRFSKVSIFSGLNNLEDISMQPQYNAICGITENELARYFQVGIREMAEKNNESETSIHAKLKTNYDGYHFANSDVDVYNPFSLLNTFKSGMFGSFWFQTGTTSDLIKILEHATFAIPQLEGYRCNENLLTGSDIYLTNPVPLFFQTGYLTIKGYNARFNQYILGFPNKEVTEGFNDFLMNSYMKGSDSSVLITEFVLDVEEGRPQSFMEKLQYFFAGIPYDHSRAGKKEKEEGIRGNMEIHFQNVTFVIMKLMGFYTHTEYRTANGRIDMTVETSDYLYLMEFKIDSTPEKAMSQINEKDYPLPFRLSRKNIFKIGANFDTKTRQLEGWIIDSVYP